MKSASLAFILTVYFVDAFVGLRMLCPLEGMQTPSIVDRARAYRVIGGANGVPCDNVSVGICIYIRIYNYHRNRLKGLACSCFTLEER